jgi:hypothetical protein
MNKRVITRWRAASIHLGLSVVVAAAVLAAIYFYWYPGALFGAAGGRELFLLIALVDVTIGPIITLIVYRQGKKGMRFDLAVIAVLQATALSYGAWVLYESRPVWIVFVKDRFELVRANEVLEDGRRIARPPFNELALDGPRLAGARMPADPVEQFQIGMTAVQGFDLQSYPQHFVPYDELRPQVLQRAKPIATLRQFNGDAAEISGLPARFGRDEAGLAFLPLRAGRRDLAAIVDSRSGAFLGTAALKPWEY